MARTTAALKATAPAKRAAAPKSRSHDEAMIESLRNDPKFASEYLRLALEDSSTDGGRENLLIALRRVAEAQGMADVATRAGMKRESLYRLLSPKGNPTLSTLLAVFNAAGLQLSVAPAGNG
jgi:probable addiction module antidote protein